MALTALQERLRHELNVSRESVYFELRSVIDNPETNTIEMLRAIDMLCRMFGLYSQPPASQNDASSNSTTSLGLQGMTDNELEHLISNDNA